MQKEPEHRPEEPVVIRRISKLSFKAVTFSHKNARHLAIDHISFEAKLGDTLAFVGPFGSGKSTLVKLLVGLYIPVL